MSRYLMLDIGAGTLDILYHNDQTQQPYKAVVRSPVQTVAENASRLRGPLLVTGGEMGGGPITEVLKHRARTDGVVISAQAAATLHHDLKRVRQWGLRVVAEEDLDDAADRRTMTSLVLGDLEIPRLERIIEGFGVPFEFDVVAICAQDHGAAPQGVSHLDFRHNLFSELLETVSSPHALLFAPADIPTAFNRLRSIARSAAALPTREIYVMDSGMAAVLGASRDKRCFERDPIVVLDVATSHTVAAVLENGALAAEFEYHTRDITAARLDSLIVQMAEGTLSHAQILAEGGHGAYCRRTVGFDRIELILATGPQRRLVTESRLPIVFGAPWGDNMMTGTVGLLEAVRHRKGLPPLEAI